MTTLNSTHSNGHRRVLLSKWTTCSMGYAISGYPYDPCGYDKFFDIATENTNVLLNTVIDVFDIPNKRVFFKGDWYKY